MKMYRCALLSVIAAVSLCVFLFSACNSGVDSNNEATDTSRQEASKEKVADKQTKDEAPGAAVSEESKVPTFKEQAQKLQANIKTFNEIDKKTVVNVQKGLGTSEE